MTKLQNDTPCETKRHPYPTPATSTNLLLSPSSEGLFLWASYGIRTPCGTTVFKKQIANQHDSIPFKSIRLPQLCLNCRTIIRSAAKRGKADPHCAVAERTKLPIVKIYGMTPSWFSFLVPNHLRPFSATPLDSTASITPYSSRTKTLLFCNWTTYKSVSTPRHLHYFKLLSNN